MIVKYSVFLLSQEKDIKLELNLHDKENVIHFSKNIWYLPLLFYTTISNPVLESE